jgi:hypothetical protein
VPVSVSIKQDDLALILSFTSSGKPCAAKTAPSTPAVGAAAKRHAKLNVITAKTAAAIQNFDLFLRIKNYLYFVLEVVFAKGTEKIRRETDILL